MRLDRYLAEISVGSRKEVKKLIRDGMISVDGVTVTDAGYSVVPESACVALNGEELLYAKYEYYMLYKPCGTVCAVRDNRHPTVMELVDSKRKDLFPVGRLDLDTEGLLLVTNDGVLAHKLLSPKWHVDKTYYALVYGNLQESDLRRLENGMDIGDERLTLPAVANCVRVCPLCETEELALFGEEHLARTAELTETLEIDTMCSYLELTLHEGRYHQVKRMLSALGKPVLYLKRTAMAGLVLDEGLQKGECRELSSGEIAGLIYENIVLANQG